LANFIRFFTMKSMVNSQIFARMRVMQRALYEITTSHPARPWNWLSQLQNTVEEMRP
jgi:hypothetical protein